jgi:hypothetical protein
MLCRVVLTRAIRCNIPEDTILHSHRRENLKLGLVWLIFANNLSISLSLASDEHDKIRAFHCVHPTYRSMVPEGSLSYLKKLATWIHPVSNQTCPHLPPFTSRSPLCSLQNIRLKYMHFSILPSNIHITNPTLHTVHYVIDVYLFEMQMGLIVLIIRSRYHKLSSSLCNCRPPLWSSGQSSWLLTQRFQVRFQELPDFRSSSRSGTGSTQPLWG